MDNYLYIDVETYSDLDLTEVGVYKYVSSPNFEILLIGYAFNNEPIQIIDLASGDKIPERFEDALFDDNIKKCAHNAMFERNTFRRIGYDISPENWHCTMIHAAYCGLPLKLQTIAEILDLPTKKANTGTLLINYFSKPCKATGTNGGRTRNLPQHSPSKWQAFREYLHDDVVVARDIRQYLSEYVIPEFDSQLYILDQEINDYGISVDTDFIQKAIVIDNWFSEILTQELYDITKLDNPNSLAQLKAWLSVKAKKKITSLTKESVDQLLTSTEDQTIRRVLELRQQLGKTSTAKYASMMNCEYGNNNRVRGLFQYYGANSTGRWAARLVQLHNLPRNYLNDLELARNIVKEADGPLLEMLFGNVPDTLSQLIRTAFVASDNNTFIVADFSAIESRVISWYANEKWRLDVFNTHGKIYEATASKMFNIPFESITKDSEYRQRGKVAELALGFGGSKDAITRMDRDNEIADEDKPGLVRIWRKANPAIVKFWHRINNIALECVKRRKRIVCSLDFTELIFDCDGIVLTITLPSGHVLYYWEPKIGENRFGGESVTYMNINQKTKKWQREDTYGGKLAENIVQATARDLLGYAMIKLHSLQYNICMHVHDEVIVEHLKSLAEKEYTKIIALLSEEVPWAKGLPMAAAGYITDFYKKD